jgi:hypothetical protein
VRRREGNNDYQKASFNQKSWKFNQSHSSQNYKSYLRLRPQILEIVAIISPSPHVLPELFLSDRTLEINCNPDTGPSALFLLDK